MKRIAAIFLMFALALSMTACGLKEAVQDKTREILGGAAEQTGQTGNGESGGGQPYTNAAEGGKHGIASVASPGGYYDRLEEEWQNAPDEGYVWTITFDDAERLDVMGLATVDYALKLSCSHVGPDMYGPYKGELEMSYNADLDNLMELLTITGGSASYDADGWFKNGNFTMEADGFDQDEEDLFVSTLEPASDLSAEEQAIRHPRFGQPA
jgi:hypothetical protein